MNEAKTRLRKLSKFRTLGLTLQFMLILKPRLHDRFFLVAIGFFLDRVIVHRVFLAARLHDGVFFV